MPLTDSDKAALVSGLPRICREAIDRYTLEEQATNGQRKREIAALEFQVPEKQWPQEVRDAFAAQVVNGVPIPARAMLSIPTLDQPIQLVLNAERAAQLSPTIHPISEDADDDTAEMIQGLYRHIEVDSRANLARSWAFERAVKCGRGGWRVMTEYDPDGGHPSDQKIVIKRLLYQESMRLDPYAQEPDFSDGDWGIISSWMPLDRFRRHWPKAQAGAYTDGEFAELMEAVPGWFEEDQQGKAVLVVEYCYKEFTTRTKVALADGRPKWQDEMGEGDELATDDGAYSREEQDYVLKWCKLTATDVLEERKLDGRYIPMIPSIGKELIPFDAERRWQGIIEPNMDAVRMANYGASGLVQSASLEPKAPFDIDPREIETFESWWQQANVRNFPYLPRHKVIDGQMMPEIGRHQADMSKIQMNGIVYDRAMQFLHTGTGAWEATLGQSAPNTKTKGGTELLQQQHEQGNSNWLDNLAEISLTYEAKVILDLIPRVYDRPGRVVRIVTGEGDPRKNTKQVMLGKPFVTGPNGRPLPAPQMPQEGGFQPQGSVLGLQGAPQGKVKHFDLTKGRYGVVVSIGKAYQSRVQEGSDRIGQIIQAEPALLPVVGPNWMEFQDFPGAKELAKLLLKMRDQQFPFLRDEEEAPDAQAQLQQMKGQIQQMSEQLKQAGQLIQTKQVEQQGKLQQTALSEKAETERTDMKLAADADKAAKDRAVKLDVAAMSAGIEKLQLFMLELARLGGQSHDVGLAAQDHAHALEQQAAAARTAAVAAQQQHGQAMQQADQGQAHALEQGEQAAALAPEPASNNGSGA